METSKSCTCTNKAVQRYRILRLLSRILGKPVGGASWHRIPPYIRHQIDRQGPPGHFWTQPHDSPPEVGLFDLPLRPVLYPWRTLCESHDGPVYRHVTVPHPCMLYTAANEVYICHYCPRPELSAQDCQNTDYVPPPFKTSPK